MSGWWDIAYRAGAPWDFGSPPEELVKLVEEGHVKPGKVLDIGCGTGTCVTYLASKGFDAYGLDISKVAIRKARGKAQTLGVKCDLRVMDFLDVKAASKLAMTFEVLLDVGCFHSLSAQDRLSYKESLNVVSQPRSTYLLWCFLRGSRWTPGPPGVDRDEVERTLPNRYRVVEKRILDTSFREMLFYIMQRD